VTSSSPEPHESALGRWLAAAPGTFFVLFAAGASFSTYFCMYAFRKPFAAAQYSGERLGELDLKTALIISQIIGYTLSKYIGIKVCSEASRGQRARMLVLLVLLAEAALVLFALAPAPLKVTAIFLNGLPLGMVWGLVVWYLEGRRTSELLLAGLSCSFILASGAVKDVGLWLMADLGVAESWMPAATGLCFLPLFLLSVWLLNQIPQPSAADVAARVEREPMDRDSRGAFFRRFLPGMLLLITAYFFLTAYRDFRDNFGVEIFAGLGYEGKPALFTRSETIVAFGVLAALALLNLIKDNRRGLAGAFFIMITGAVILGGSTLLHDAGVIDGFWWMTLVGLGSYLAYVPYGSVLFDRLIASTRLVGTAVFAIYVADAAGYTGSVGVQLYKDLARGELTRLSFFKGFTYLVSAVALAMLILSCAYFLGRTRRRAMGS
jgi:hypothetical protein